MIKFLREQGGELKWDEGKESSELCELARAGDLERVKLLLNCGCSANAADYDRCASMLLKGGCDANAAGCDKRTCLHLAASEGNLTVAEALCKHAGIDVNCKDRWNNTPLSDAVGHMISTRKSRRCCTATARACRTSQRSCRAASMCI